MANISYATASVPVREDLLAAHRRAWQRLAQAGNWWTGAELKLARFASTASTP